MTARIRTNPTMTKTADRTACAWCVDCGARWDRPNALAPGAIHAKAFGHVVRGSLHVEVTYDGRTEFDA